MQKFMLSKIDVARRQLITAIRLYFNWGDEVSIHTLASSSRNVLCNLCAHREVKYPLQLEELLNDFVDTKHHKEFHRKYRKHENFFKHADRDPEATLDFNPFISEYKLIEAVEAYTVLSGEQIPEFHIYRGWWLISNQKVLKNASQEFINTLNGVQYSSKQRTQFFNDMMSILSGQSAV